MTVREERAASGARALAPDPKCWIGALAPIPNAQKTLKNSRCAAFIVRFLSALDMPQPAHNKSRRGRFADARSRCRSGLATAELTTRCHFLTTYQLFAMSCAS